MPAPASRLKALGAAKPDMKLSINDVYTLCVQGVVAIGADFKAASGLFADAMQLCRRREQRCLVGDQGVGFAQLRRRPLAATAAAHSGGDRPHLRGIARQGKSLVVLLDLPVLIDVADAPQTIAPPAIERSWGGR